MHALRWVEKHWELSIVFWNNLDLSSQSIRCKQSLQHSPYMLQCYAHAKKCNGSPPEKKSTWSFLSMRLNKDNRKREIFTEVCLRRQEPSQGGHWATRWPFYSQDQETEMVWTCYTSNRTCKHHHAGHSTRREETRQTKKKCWHDNIKEWTELPLAKTLRLAEDRDGWRKIIKTSVVPLQPPNG